MATGPAQQQRASSQWATTTGQIHLRTTIPVRCREPQGSRGHALARLAEEAETAVDPAVFAATFDLFRVANRLMYDFETTVHRPLGMSWAGFSGAVLHLDRRGGRTARARETLRGIQRDGIERAEHAGAGRPREPQTAVVGQARRHGRDHGAGPQPGEGGVRASARARASMAGEPRAAVDHRLVALLRHLLELPRPGAPTTPPVSHR